MKRVSETMRQALLRAVVFYEVRLRSGCARAGAFLGGLALLSAGLGQISNAQVVELSYSGMDYDPGLISCAVDAIFQLIEGAFGALVMVIAGLGAIIASALGAYRASLSMLIVAVGSFILRSLVSLFYGTDFTSCTPGGQ